MKTFFTHLFSLSKFFLLLSLNSSLLTFLVLHPFFYCNWPFSCWYQGSSLKSFVALHLWSLLDFVSPFFPYFLFLFLFHSFASPLFFFYFSSSCSVFSLLLLLWFLLDKFYFRHEEGRGGINPKLSISPSKRESSYSPCLVGVGLWQLSFMEPVDAHGIKR